MTNVTVYDNCVKILENLANEADTSIAEVLDEILCDYISDNQLFRK